MKEEYIPLMRKAVEWVEVEAEKGVGTAACQWHQASWVWAAQYRAQAFQVSAADCGTAYCIAGYMGMMLDERYTDTSVVNNIDVDDFVVEELGLSDDEASDLFAGSNTVERVREVAERIVGGPL